MLYTFALTFILSFLLIGIVRHKAFDWKLVDIPNERSEHKNRIPRSAGIGFVLASLIGIGIFYPEMLLKHGFIFGAIAMVFAVGIYDDRYQTVPKIKFTVLILASIMLLMDGLLIGHLGKCCGVSLMLPVAVAMLFTVFSVVGFTNALNLIDGLDGLAGSVSIVILGTLFVVGYHHHDTFIMVLSGAFVASLAAFLIFNWNPASIFMGDSGSLTLGFVISLLAIKALDYLSPISILYLAAIPLLDTFVVMIRRKKNGRSMFAADKCHFHHVLQTFFLERTKLTVTFLVILQIVYSLVGVYLKKNVDILLPLVIFTLNTVLVYLLITTMIKRQGRVCA